LNERDSVRAGSGEGDSARRALHAASEEIEALREGPWTGPESRGRVLRVANAVDRALRRLLRDDEYAALDIRLRALAPDETTTESVLSELRRNERLSMELAAGIHDLLATRRRLEQGSPADGKDAQRAVRVADRLGREIDSLPGRADGAVIDPPEHMPMRPDVARVTGVGGIDEPAGDALEVTRRSPRRAKRGASRAAVVTISGLILIVLLVVGVRVFAVGGPDHMEQGIALFRSGALSEAAHHFWRHAEANPSDATPHLYLARIHRRLQRPDLAADALREAQRLAPDDSGVHRELGFLLLDTGRPEVAIARFERAIELEPESSEGWVGLLRALREAGNHEQVAATLARAPAEVRALLSAPEGGAPGQTGQ